MATPVATPPDDRPSVVGNVLLPHPSARWRGHHALENRQWRGLLLVAAGDLEFFVTELERPDLWVVNPALSVAAFGVHDPRIARGLVQSLLYAGLSNEDGGEFLFTLAFLIGADEKSIAQQMTTVEAELRTVRDLCEAKSTGIA